MENACRPMNFMMGQINVALIWLFLAAISFSLKMLKGPCCKNYWFQELRCRLRGQRVYSSRGCLWATFQYL